MRMPQRLDRTPMAGFTLIEALVATALMGFILAALATITAQWLPNWNHGIVRVQRNEQVALGLERLASRPCSRRFHPGQPSDPQAVLRWRKPLSHVCAHRFGSRMQDPDSNLFALPKSAVNGGPFWSGRAHRLCQALIVNRTSRTPLCCCGHLIDSRFRMPGPIEIGERIGGSKFNCRTQSN